MNLEQMQKKLLAAARANPPSDAVPYAFEKRVMARLQTPPAEDAFLQWGRALWRGAIACVAVALLSSAWALLPIKNSNDLSQDLEHTVLASLEEADNSAW